jgi:hypothetical protein
MPKKKRGVADSRVKLTDAVTYVAGRRASLQVVDNGLLINRRGGMHGANS